MEFRELNEGDLDSLVKLYEQLDGANGNFTTEAARAIWKSEIEGNKDIKYFGAVDGGKVISTCFCIIIPNLTRIGSSACFVENVVTHVNHRGRGYATACLNYAKELAIKADCYKMMLTTGSKNESTLSFYKRAGYNCVDKTAFIQWL